jgi:hypothetical protein
MQHYQTLVPKATMQPYLNKWQEQTGSSTWNSLIMKGFDKWTPRIAVEAFLYSPNRFMEFFDIIEDEYRLIRHYMLQDGLIHKVKPPTVVERKVDKEPTIDLNKILSDFFNVIWQVIKWTFIIGLILLFIIYWCSFPLI